jgi:cytidyltransferase-like protein
VGGTFNRLHAGHRLLLSTAFGVGDLVYVGVTSDALVKRMRGQRAKAVRPYAERAEGVRRLLEPFGKDRFTIAALDDPLIPVERPEFDAIVVSHQTLPTAEEINALRQQRGLPALKIVVVPMLKAFDGKPISATRILAGEIDEDGRPAKAAGKPQPRSPGPRRRKARATGRKGAPKGAGARSSARKGSRPAGPRSRR